MVDRIGDRSATHTNFVDAMKQKDEIGADDCRYAIYDYRFKLETQEDNSSRQQDPVLVNNALLLFMYCPDTTPIRNKMVYSATFDTLIRAFVGIKKALTINNESDLKEEFIRANMT